MGSSLGLGVNLDPMITHLRFQRVTLGVEYYEVGVLLWHMTVNAVAADLVVAAGERGRPGLVTTQAALRERGYIMLNRMHIMTGQAGHGR